MKRSITFEEAVEKYPGRFTMEHVPNWAILKTPVGDYPGPHYSSDLEWYENTLFPGEGTDSIQLATDDKSFSYNKSYPLGQFLEKPYERRDV
jgi:hypothetical protein